MTHFIFNILYHLPVMKQRYPVVSDELCEDAYYHIGYYLKWGWIIPYIWIIQILGREFITDGHLKRIWNKTETPEELLDLKTDLLTRFAGLVIPLAVWTGVLICLS